jgi:hypothetical protein
VRMRGRGSSGGKRGKCLKGKKRVLQTPGKWVSRRQHLLSQSALRAASIQDLEFVCQKVATA